MDWGFGWLLEYVNKFWETFVSILEWLGDGIIWATKASVFSMFDGLLTCISAYTSSLDFGSFLANLSGLWSLLPPNAVYVIGQCGFAQGLALISQAIIIRMALNLIPAAFTRI